MYNIKIAFHDKLMQGEVPVAYIVINTHLGYRAYAEKELGEVFDVLGYIADGSHLADGSIRAGADSAGVIEKSARVLSFGSFERTLSPKKDDVITSYLRKQMQHLSIELDNVDRYFSKLISKEPFLSREIVLYVGFEGLPSTHISIFKGRISELSLLPTLTIEADER